MNFFISVVFIYIIRSPPLDGLNYNVNFYVNLVKHLFLFIKSIVYGGLYNDLEEPTVLLFSRIYIKSLTICWGNN